MQATTRKRRVSPNVYRLCCKGISSTEIGDEKQRPSMRIDHTNLLALFIISVCVGSVPAGAAAADDEGREERGVAIENLQRVGGILESGSFILQAPQEKRSSKTTKGQEKQERKAEKGKQKDTNKEVEESNEHTVPPTRCAQNLRDAVNGAISLISGTRLLVEHLLRLWNSVPYVPMLVCPSSLFPYNPTLPWPRRESLKKGDLLRDVLDNGILIVAGVGGASLSDGQVQLTVAKDRGDEGNYNKADPTGFFPDYLRAIADTIEKQYNAPIQVRWLFYPSVESAQAGVLRGEAHMTDIYFLLAQSTPGEPQPLAHFYSTCPVVGSPVLLIVREKPAYSESDIKDLLSLNRIISRANTDADRRVIFVNQELATTVRHCLSPSALIGFAENIKEAAQMVLVGNALAVVTTGVLPRLHSLLKVVNARVLLGKGAWIERTYAVECVEEEHGLNLAAYARERNREEAKRLYRGKLETGGSGNPSGTRRTAILCALWIVLLSVSVSL